ncbi:MAG: Rad52/Rad22 family DNA repair protein [Acidobacteriaceae bacterium]
MSDHTLNLPSVGLDTQKLLAELEIPFTPAHVHWRVMNTSHDKKRGQIVPYADPRAYTDRLNALFTPQGWTRNYRIETMNNITRIKKGEAIVSGKVLVTCTLTINDLGEHSGTGEEWADDDNGMTAADAQAFKRACSCFGLGRYFYYFRPPWVDLDEHRQPKRLPSLPIWALPENWRKGMRPPGSNGNGNESGNGHSNGSAGKNGSGNGKGHGGKPDGDLDGRIAKLETAVGPAFYRNVLRRHGRANQPRLIRDTATKERVLSILESATRGFGRLQAVSKRLPPETINALLAKLQAPTPSEIKDMKTLQAVVLGLEELAGPSQHAR